MIYQVDFEDGFAVGWDTQWDPEMVIIQLGDGNHVYRASDSQPVLALPEDVFDYAIESRIMKHAGADGIAGVDVRWTGGDRGFQGKYTAYIDFSGGWIHLVETDSTWEEVQEPQGLAVHYQVPFSADNWYTVAIEARGSTISLFLNGQLFGSDEDDTLRSNRVGLSCWDGDLGRHEFYFDDVRVWSVE